MKEIYGGKGRLWVKWLLAESKLWWQGGINGDAMSMLLYWEKSKQNDVQCNVELEGAER